MDEVSGTHGDSPPRFFTRLVPRVAWCADGVIRAGGHPTTPMSLTSLKTDATPVELNGHRLKCLMCSAEMFHRRRSHVDTAMVTTMNPEWVDRQVQCLVCDDCGFIHWFWVG